MYATGGCCSNFSLAGARKENLRRCQLAPSANAAPETLPLTGRTQSRGDGDRRRRICPVLSHPFPPLSVLDYLSSPPGARQTHVPEKRKRNEGQQRRDRNN